MAVLIGLLLLQVRANTNIGFVQPENEETPSSQGYDDCIQKESLKRMRNQLMDRIQLLDSNTIVNIDIQLEKYQQSLDSIVQNLNTIDAHSFLHNEYHRCENVIQFSEDSPFKVYYHLMTMEACYEKDRQLNESSLRGLAKL